MMWFKKKKNLRQTTYEVIQSLIENCVEIYDADKDVLYVYLALKRQNK